VKGRSSAYEVNLTAKQACAARDALAKTIYERMFSWLIGRCNLMLSSDAPSSGFIGILDIFGV
jgi:myosin-1